MPAYEWDEAKRAANLAKHGFDFTDAHLVYEDSAKLTLNMNRKGEPRKQDLALVQVHGFILALAYVERASRIRVISLRKASRKERTIYADRKQD